VPSDNLQHRPVVGFRVVLLVSVRDQRDQCNEGAAYRARRVGRLVAVRADRQQQLQRTVSHWQPDILRERRLQRRWHSPNVWRDTYDASQPRWRFRTIACGPVSCARLSRSARVFSIEVICSRTNASRAGRGTTDTCPGKRLLGAITKSVAILDQSSTCPVPMHPRSG
jgi:hypothetical protein